VASVVAKPLYQWNARLLSFAEIPLIKGNGVLPFIGGMRPLIGGRSITAAFVDTPVANEARFSRRFTVSSSQVIFEHEVLRLGDQMTKGQRQCRVQRLELGIRLTGPGTHCSDVLQLRSSERRTKTQSR
jgi:hypothetical protein